MKQVGVSNDIDEGSGVIIEQQKEDDSTKQNVTIAVLDSGFSGVYIKIIYL